MDEPLSLEIFDASGTLDQSYTYHADHLGSIRFVTDSVGQIVNAYEYDSYGRPGFELEQVSQPFRYTGREWDQATELYHYRARQYDPETGRFLQEDPIGFEAGDINVYRYVTNKPLSLTDPSGKSALIESGGLSQTAASSGQIANLGVGLNCLFRSIAASVNTNQDLVSGRTGGASQCSNDLLVDTGLTSGTALGTSVLADGPLPILDHIGFRFAMIAKNLYRFITKICKAGTCKTEETVIMPGSKL